MNDKGDRDRRRGRAPAPAPQFPVRLGSYRALIAPALERLKADPSPEARTLARQLARCLECPGDRKCTGCPFLGLP